MVVRFNCAFLVAAGLFLAANTAASAAVPTAEDLAGCKLPNGQIVMPAPGSTLAASGTLLKLSNGAITDLAIVGDPPLPSAFVDRVRGGKTADIQYLPEKDPTRDALLAFSGFISELGAGSLAEHSGKELRAPLEIRRTSRNPGGLCWGIQEGVVYLVQGTDGRYTLLRILEKSPDFLVIQYVHQPDGTLKFDVPANPPVSYQKRAVGEAMAGQPGVAPGVAPGQGMGAAVPGPAATLATPAAAVPTAVQPDLQLRRAELGPGDVNEPGVIRIISGTPRTTGLEPTLDTFAHQRDQMVTTRMQVVAAAARTELEIDRKVRAMQELAMLRAEEAADLLVANVTFLNARSQTREFSVDAFHPAVAALKKLGKSATMASLKGLREMNLDSPGEGMNSARYRADLLAQVIRAVEGQDVALFLLKREMDRPTTSAQREVLEFVVEKLQPQQ